MNLLPKKSATTLSLDRALLSAAKCEAVACKCSLSSLLERWVEERLRGGSARVGECGEVPGSSHSILP